MSHAVVVGVANSIAIGIIICPDLTILKSYNPPLLPPIISVATLDLFTTIIDHNARMLAVS